MRTINWEPLGLALSSTAGVAAIGAVFGAKAAAIAALVGLALQSQAHPVAPRRDVPNATDGARVNAMLAPTTDNEATP